MINAHQRMFFVLFALLAFFPLAFSSGAARAQSAPHAAPRISGFDVEQVSQLVPGNELLFTLYGSPGATASIGIAGVDRRLPLEEVEAGVYEGTYTIRNRDRITPDAAVTANLRLGNQVASAILDESLVAVAGRSPARRGGNSAKSGAAPRIDRFHVEPAHRLVAGNDLFFTLHGSPGGRASIRIDGVKGKLRLDEVRPGVYEDTYTIKARDRIAADARVTADLRIGELDASAVLGQSLVAGSAPAANTRPVATRSCPSCGVVEAINVIQVKGDGSYVGLIAGGLAGALLGSQVGQGRGTTVAELAGAAGGAYAGREIEKNMNKTNHYEVIARLEGGGAQAFSYATQPSLKVGDKVRVENGTLVLNR